MPELNWPTIGVCWALTTVTTVVLYVVSKVVTRMLRKRRKLGRPAAEGRNIWSTTSEKSENGQTVPLMEVSSPSRPNGPSSVSSSVSSRPNSHPNDRRTKDEVSRWCNDNCLPESLVYTLREQGFKTKAALDALRPDDLQGSNALLQLPNTADKVQLRQVLTKLHDNKQHCDTLTNLNPTKPGTTKSASGTKRPEIGQSLSDSGVNSGAQSPTDNSDVFLPGLAIVDEVDGRCHRGRNGRRPPASSSSHSQSNSTKVNGLQRFNGLLSDEGLWRMANMLGHDWRHLATMLGISKQTQEQLVENNPHKTKDAIHDMLALWRSEATGSKEQMKGKLHKALIAIERSDIAKLLMDEQTHGSNSNIHNITSII